MSSSSSFELNKIAGAILGTLMLSLGLGIVSGEYFKSEKPAKAGYELPDATPAAAGAPAAAQDPPLAEVLAKASADRGAAIFKKCAACHTDDKGGKNGVGPNLFGVIGGPKGHKDDFAYSDAVKALHDKKETWSADDFYHFIKGPQAFIKGTKMTFVGLPKPQDRADVLLYLNSQSDKPIDLPKS
ncbi:cytochrome c family protein [Labrys miyagiensis]|uniref:Cytochrome c family protein n=1 Tax=Labrys miyagiensis TaxID=346912 RepID=A0ABQ6CQ63_9HYPH|nr:cytochrome c family protein [Labrys miyagiensis]GLS20849.1 cytochrome c family protein [Labrys miyagiensis]